LKENPPRWRCRRAQAYAKVCDKLKEVDALSGISGLLGWDEMVMLVGARCRIGWCWIRMHPQ
jgi:hypothetical protein